MNNPSAGAVDSAFLVGFQKYLEVLYKTPSNEAVKLLTYAIWLTIWLCLVFWARVCNVRNLILVTKHPICNNLSC